MNTFSRVLFVWFSEMSLPALPTSQNLHSYGWCFCPSCNIYIYIFFDILVYIYGNVMIVLGVQCRSTWMWDGFHRIHIRFFGSCFQYTNFVVNRLDFVEVGAFEVVEHASRLYVNSSTFMYSNIIFVFLFSVVPSPSLCYNLVLHHLIFWK